jgi:surface antigen
VIIMIKQKTKIFLIVLTFLTIIATVLVDIHFQKPVNAASFCQCTQYVKNRFGLSNDFPHAKDWNDGYLQRNGLVQTTAKPGAIVVMERSFPGADTTYGHVGVVESVDGSGRITVRGANQYVGSTLVTESDCTNVRSTPFGTSINGRGDITFWERSNNNGKVYYKAHVAGIGWQSEVSDGAVAGTTGQSLRMEAITIRVPGSQVCYKAHVEGIGWQPEVCNNAVAGTTGQSRRMEAITIRVPGRTVCYQAHVEGIGWQSEVCNNAIAGTTGQSRRMEAIKISIR